MAKRKGIGNIHTLISDNYFSRLATVIFPV
jgi:hypothetical protein